MGQAHQYGSTILVLTLLAAAGCASTVPKAKFTHEIESKARVSLNDQTKVQVDAAETVKILKADQQRLSEKIQARIESRKATNAPAADVAARTYEVDLHLTRYEKGNAFARAMLAGLGQIHIDGTITIYQMPEHALVGEFQLQKTFAWGGIYGSATSMDDIENTFADGVAAAVTGQKEESQKKKP